MAQVIGGLFKISHLLLHDSYKKEDRLSITTWFVFSYNFISSEFEFDHSVNLKSFV